MSHGDPEQWYLAGQLGMPEGKLLRVKIVKGMLHAWKGPFVPIIISPLGYEDRTKVILHNLIGDERWDPFMDPEDRAEVANIRALMKKP